MFSQFRRILEVTENTRWTDRLGRWGDTAHLTPAACLWTLTWKASTGLPGGLWPPTGSRLTRTPSLTSHRGGLYPPVQRGQTRPGDVTGGQQEGDGPVLQDREVVVDIRAWMNYRRQWNLEYLTCDILSVWFDVSQLCIEPTDYTQCSYIETTASTYCWHVEISCHFLPMFLRSFEKYIRFLIIQKLI